MTALFPEIALGSLRPINEALSDSSLSEEKAAFSVPRLLELANAIKAIVGIFDSWWKSLNELLAHGIPGHILRKQLDEFVTALAQIKQHLAQIGCMANQNIPEEFRGTEATVEADAILRDVAHTVERLLGEGQALYTRIRMPPSKDFLERAAQAISQDAGEYESSESILARLMADGDF